MTYQDNEMLRDALRRIIDELEVRPDNWHCYVANAAKIAREALKEVGDD